jgi:hypothetical protein
MWIDLGYQLDVVQQTTVALSEVIDIIICPKKNVNAGYVRSVPVYLVNNHSMTYDR